MAIRGRFGARRQERRALPAAVLFLSTVVVLAAPAPAAAGCSVAQGDFDGSGADDLRILGDAARQLLVVSYNGGTIQLQLDCNADGDYADAGDVNATYPGNLETLDVQLKGQDIVTVSDTAANVGVRRNLILSLGPGGNSASFSSFNFAPSSSQTSWVVDVFGGAGQDNLAFDLGGALNGSLFQVRGDLGAGNDNVTFTGPPSSTGGVIDLDLALGSGNNGLSVNGRAGTLAAFTWTLDAEGSSLATNVDLLSGRLDSVLVAGSRYALTANLLAGNDVFITDEFMPFSGSESRVRVKGGAGNDLLQVGSPALISSSDGLLETVLDGGQGNDVLLIEKHVEGVGTYRVRVQGGEQADTVMSSVWAEDVGFGLNNLDLLTRGGRGADSVYSAVFEPGPATYNPTGASLLDGGADANDACVFFGNGDSQRFGCESGS